MNKAMMVSLLFLIGKSTGYMHPTPIAINATVDTVEGDVIGLDIGDYPGVFLPSAMLPAGLHEGDCVKLNSSIANGVLSITLTPDPAACNLRREEIQKLRKELRSK